MLIQISETVKKKLNHGTVDTHRVNNNNIKLENFISSYSGDLNYPDQKCENKIEIFLIFFIRTLISTECCLKKKHQNKYSKKNFVYNFQVQITKHRISTQQK